MYINDKVKLVILNSEGYSWRDKGNHFDHSEWTQPFQYELPSDYAARNSAIFLNASQVVKGIDGNFKELNISRDSTVAEVIAAARNLYPGFDRNSEETCGIPISYHLFYPALSYKPLVSTARLSDLRITNGELLVLKQSIGSSRSKPRPKPVNDFTNYSDIIAMNGKIRDNDYSHHDATALNAVLLYSEEDIKLAIYTRAYFDLFRKMSGANLRFRIVEEQLKGSTYSNQTFWKIRLQREAYLTWSLLGWVRSKPYKKLKALDIACNLGVYPDQLPCIVLFDNLDRLEKIVIPVRGEYNFFFKYFFTTINACLNKIPTNGKSHHNSINRITAPYSSYDDLKHGKRKISEILRRRNGKSSLKTRHTCKADSDVLNLNNGRLFDTLRVILESSPSKEEPLRSVYNLNGLPVIINHPNGFINQTFTTSMKSVQNPFVTQTVFDTQKINLEILRLVELVSDVKDLPFGTKEDAVQTLHSIADQVGKRNGKSKRNQKELLNIF